RAPRVRFRMRRHRKTNPWREPTASLYLDTCKLGTMSSVRPNKNALVPAKTNEGVIKKLLAN
ncbi:MAG: hypothetical protein Q3982_08730, partial [Phoenicibacter congonensis]|nr:hypothetical protein [Phoenicibacter congonensis]